MAGAVYTTFAAAPHGPPHDMGDGVGAAIASVRIVVMIGLGTSQRVEDPFVGILLVLEQPSKLIGWNAAHGSGCDRETYEPTLPNSPA